MDAKVYRPDFDWKGQIIGVLDDHYIGDVTGVILGGPSVQPVPRFPGVVSTEGQIGVPWQQDSGIVVQQRDRLVMDGVLHAVTSDRLWTGCNVLTGTQPSYYWVEVQSST